MEVESMPAGAVPTLEEFRPVVLEVLKDGNQRSLTSLRERAAEVVGLSEEARAQEVPSGQLRYVNRINWACSTLTSAGLLDRPKRGWYQITEQGREVADRRLSSYTEQEMMEWPAFRAHQNEVAQRKADEGIALSEPSTPADPVEVIEEAAQTLTAEVETELRRRLQASSPEFFEKAVVELLWAMGYGGAHGQKRHVGKTGDGGIDGVIDQDALGLQKIYVQAKRYGDGNNVQAGEVRDFYGALRARGAEKGVFITTSKFSAGARDTAARFSGEVVLIDGIRLTALMLDYSVAVQEAHTFSLYEVDEDFFESDLV